MVDRVLVLLVLAKVVSWSRWHPVSGPPDKLGIPVPRKLQTFSLFFLTKPFRWAPFTCFLKGFSFPREIVFNFFLPENLFPFSSRALVCDSQHWERQQRQVPCSGKPAQNYYKIIALSLSNFKLFLNWNQYCKFCNVSKDMKFHHINQSTNIIVQVLWIRGCENHFWWIWYNFARLRGIYFGA